MDWIKVSERVPQHKQEVKVFLEGREFGVYTRKENAVYLDYLGRGGEFYDAKDETFINNVSKWKPIESTK